MSQPALRTARIAALAVVWALAFAAPALALDLDAAKRAGQVGERVDGYVGAVSASPSEEVRELVERINRGRRAHYAEIAERNGVDISTVAARAGAKLVKDAEPGEWVLDSTGQWKQR